MKKKFRIPIGFSDHFIGNDAAKKAKKLGATFFEKHVTMNPSDIGPDHKFAMKINELDKYINQIKKTKTTVKKINKKFISLSNREKKNRDKYTKSIIVKSKILKGSKITKNKLYIARPGNGIPPINFDKIINKVAKINLFPEKILKWQQIKR